MSDVNKILENLAVSEHKTKLMTEDITTMNEKLKKLETELTLSKAKRLKLDQELLYKVKIVEDKKGELSILRNQLMIWQQILNEKTACLRQQQQQLEITQESVCNLREKFCEDVNLFVDKYDPFIGENHQVILSEVQNNRVASTIKSRNIELEKDITDLQAAIKTNRNLHAIEVDALQFEKEKLDAEAASLMDRLKHFEEPFKREPSQNSMEPNTPSTIYSKHYPNNSFQELPRQDEENSTEDMVACNDVGRPTRQKKRFSKNHTKENSQTENASQESQIPVKKHKGFIPIATVHKKTNKQSNIKQYFKKL